MDDGGAKRDDLFMHSVNSLQRARNPPRSGESRKKNEDINQLTVPSTNRNPYVSQQQNLHSSSAAPCIPSVKNPFFLAAASTPDARENFSPPENHIMGLPHARWP